jgi:hypothetical protein
MLESGSSGSVRGASSNGRPYREPRPILDLSGKPASFHFHQELVRPASNATIFSETEIVR